MKDAVSAFTQRELQSGAQFNSHIMKGLNLNLAGFMYTTQRNKN